MSSARVAVVMITRNRREKACGTVRHLLGLPERPHVLVVDNGSSDGTAQAIRHLFPEVEVISPGRNLGAAGRNLGVTHAATPYVAFSDDETAWAAGALRTAADVLHEHPSVALVAARVLVHPGGHEDATCRLMAESALGRLPGTPWPRILGFLGGAAMVRRSAFLAVGGFEPRLLIRGEEELLALDLATAGWHLVYVPDVVVHHSPAPHAEGRWSKGGYQVRNRLWVCWLRYPARPALKRTVSTLVSERPRIQMTVNLARALRGLPWILRKRRQLPASVVRELDLLRRSDISTFPNGLCPTLQRPWDSNRGIGGRGGIDRGSAW